MKKILLLLLWLLAAALPVRAQQGFYLQPSAGWSMPAGAYHQVSQVGDTVEEAIVVSRSGFSYQRLRGVLLNLDAGYRFGHWGLGLSAGKFGHGAGNFAYDFDFPHSLEGGGLDVRYLGFGPDYYWRAGKWQMAGRVRAGLAGIDIQEMKVFYTGSDMAEPALLYHAQPDPENPGSIKYGSAVFEVRYALGSRFGLFVRTAYWRGLGKGLRMHETMYPPFDANADGKIDGTDVHHFSRDIYEVQQSRLVRPSAFQLSIGLAIGLGKTGKPRPKHKPSGKKTVQAAKPDKPESRRRIVLVSPANGETYGQGEQPRQFRWKVLGGDYDNPEYIVQVQKLGVQSREYVGKTKETRIDAERLFGKDLPDGSYRWWVTEGHTGDKSPAWTFNKSSCDINFQLDSLQIECLGYEGNQRKFRICFQSDYASPTGDLTYNQTGSGIFVTDQSNASLNYTFVQPAGLTTQPGSGSTVQYCLDVWAGQGVHAITIGLQGDDLDPSPVICRPGVSTVLDSLPDCLCDDCDRIQIDASGLQVVEQNGQFFLDGSLQVNVPVYAVEFQWVSMQYSSNPPACSRGISGVETSGIFLQSGSSVNNDTQLQFFNENVSGLPASNTSASHDVKYTSSSPMQGAIPVHLQMGVPGPLSGLDASCCSMQYQVCLRILVYYEDGTCKSCDMVQCITFNN